MANDNPIIHENPNIAEAGKKTQFGQPGGPDPVAAVKSEARQNAWSVRAALKHIASQDLELPDTDNEEIFNAELDKQLRKLRYTRKGHSSLPHLIALRQFEKALKKGDTLASNFVTENMEGKLSQELVIPSSKPAPTNNRTLEEASATYKEYMGT